MLFLSQESLPITSLSNLAGLQIHRKSTISYPNIVWSVRPLFPIEFRNLGSTELGRRIFLGVLSKYSTTFYCLNLLCICVRERGKKIQRENYISEFH